MCPRLANTPCFFIAFFKIFFNDPYSKSCVVTRYTVKLVYSKTGNAQMQ